MKKTTIVHYVCATILACCFFLPTAQAFQGRRAPAPFPGVKPLFRMLDDINLAPEQEDALQQAEDAMRAAIDPLADQLKSLTAYRMVLAPELNEAAAQEAIAKQSELQCQIAQIVANANLQAAKILTPEQRALVLERIEQRRAARGSDNSTYGPMCRRPRQ